MTNEHSSIAVRISKLQSRWIESLRSGKEYKIVRWLIHQHDLPLVNGFYKLESSPYGKIDELLVVMLTDFQSFDTYAFQVSKDWVAEYEKGLQKCPDLPWKEFSRYKERVNNTIDATHQEDLLADILTSYRKYVPGDLDRMLLLGIVPRNVSSYKDMNEWLDLFLSKLPFNIGITLIDYNGQEVYGELIQRRKLEIRTILLEDMDMQGAYAELMRQGNPNDPNVQVRMIVLEMGKAAQAKNQKEVHRLGAKLIEIGQASGDINLWTYTYLVYAGFLFEFKDEEVLLLLDKGINIINKVAKNRKSDSIAMLLPFYGYKASYYNFIKQHEQSFEWFMREVQEALEQENIFAAISACKKAIIVADSHSMQSRMFDILCTIYDEFYVLDDANLKLTEMSFVTAFYLRHNNEISEEESLIVRNRMSTLFGKKWESRSLTKIGRFTNPQKLMENAFN